MNLSLLSDRDITILVHAQVSNLVYSAHRV
jgi:hypothetical protein